MEADLIKATDVPSGIFGNRADISDFRSLPLSVQFRAIRDGVLVYAANGPARIRFESEVVEEHLDIEPHRREHIDGWIRDVSSSGC